MLLVGSLLCRNVGLLGGGGFGQVVRLELPIRTCSAWVVPVRKARSSRSSIIELEKSCKIIFCAKFLDVCNDIIKSLAPFHTEIWLLKKRVFFEEFFFQTGNSKLSILLKLDNFI